MELVAVKPWTGAMSDGCSVPPFLRRWLPLETAEQQAACRRHDEQYYYGGSADARFWVDLTFAVELAQAGMSRRRARLYFIAVRIFGHPRLNWLTRLMLGRPVAWANGGGVFRYT